MKKRILFGLVAVLGMAGCADLATTARDAIATNYGYITYAQNEYSTKCKADPASSPACSLVNRDIAANNTAIDMLEAYCAGVPAPGQANFAQGGPCVPVNSAAAALQAAISGLNQLLADLKPLVSPGTTGAPAKPAGAGGTAEDSYARAEAYRL